MKHMPADKLINAIGWRRVFPPLFPTICTCVCGPPPPPHHFRSFKFGLHVFTNVRRLYVRLVPYRSFGLARRRLIHMSCRRRHCGKEGFVLIRHCGDPTLMRVVPIAAALSYGMRPMLLKDESTIPYAKRVSNWLQI